MRINPRHILAGIFCCTVVVLSSFTIINYPGRAAVYLFFTVVVNALLVLGFTKKKIFFDMFIGIFFWLGFWLKFSVRVGFLDGSFHEPVGYYFTGTGVDFDRALLVASCGASALLVANFLRRRFIFTYSGVAVRERLEGIFEFYRTHRTTILCLFLCLFTFIAVSNGIFANYQRGGIPRTILPFLLKGIYTWLLLFGLASVSAIILDCEFRLRSNPYLAPMLCLLECFASNVSMLSRGMILNGSGLILGAIENARKRSIRVSMKYTLVFFIIFGILFASSVIVVNHIRGYTEEARPVGSITAHGSAAAIKSRTVVLFLDRWVGIEGVMAVSSYPDLGWALWKRAWQEKFSHYSMTLYDQIFIESPYRNTDQSRHHFISLPGIVAFCFYPGSFSFLFGTMLLLGLLAASIEVFICKASGANIILCSLLAQVIASRYAHFGYVPSQSYLLFGSIFLNVMLIYACNRVLLLWAKN